MKKQADANAAKYSEANQLKPQEIFRSSRHLKMLEYLNDPFHPVLDGFPSSLKG